MIVQIIIRSFSHAVSKSSRFLPINITEIISSLLNANQCTVIVNKLLLITSQIINFHSWKIWSASETYAHTHILTLMYTCTHENMTPWYKKKRTQKNLANNKKFDKKFNLLKSICFFISCTVEWYLIIVKGRCMPTSSWRVWKPHFSSTWIFMASPKKWKNINAVLLVNSRSRSYLTPNIHNYIPKNRICT